MTYLDMAFLFAFVILLIMLGHATYRIVKTDRKHQKERSSAEHKVIMDQHALDLGRQLDIQQSEARILEARLERESRLKDKEKQDKELQRYILAMSAGDDSSEVSTHSTVSVSDSISSSSYSSDSGSSSSSCD
jgi:hypothetical protein